MSTEAERAWAAGLFEGEGTATMNEDGPFLALRMTDFEPVRHFAEIVGLGTVYGPYENRAAERRDGSKRKPFLLWMARGDDGWFVATILRPWLGARRRAQIDECFQKTRENAAKVVMAEGG